MLALFLLSIFLFYLGSPYKLVRNKPVKARTVEMPISFDQSLEEIKVERARLLKKLMHLTETVHRMRDLLIKTEMELYRRKSMIIYCINCQIIEHLPKNLFSIRLHKDFVHISKGGFDARGIY